MPRRKSKKRHKTVTREVWKKARRVLSRHSKKLLRRDGVVGVDLGIKRAGGKLVGPSIRVHVSRKIDKKELSSRRLLPKKIEGIALDVVETTFKVRACPSSSARHRAVVSPLVGGCSISLFGERSFGTLGAIAVSTAGSPGGLTCSHVCSEGDQVVQPHRSGPDIGGVLRDLRTAEVDAAFISFDGRRQSEARVLNYGQVSQRPLDVRPEDLPLQVVLVGACSGRTRGKVISTDFQGWVEYPDGEKFVRGQLCIEPDGAAVFSRSGDSGGGVLRNSQFVGMLIAAGKEVLGGIGLATPMSRVVSKLGVELA